MRKRLVAPARQDKSRPDHEWLDLERLAEVEITSEDAAYPIESALLPDGRAGWRAAEPGRQSIRLLFSNPQRIQWIRLGFVEASVERTQEYVLRWSADGGRSFRDIVRQQWNFNPGGSSTETEDHHVELSGVTTLELEIVPNIGGGDAVATLAQFRVA